ncbi:MAG TPA: SpoIIE family protein phosphatase [Mycobacteriales bacterium]
MAAASGSDEGLWVVREQRPASGFGRAEALLATMPVGFILWDRAWRCAGVNAEGERLCGRRAADLRGQVLWDLFPDVVGTEFETVYRRVAATGSPESLEIFYPAPLNRWLDIHVAADEAGVAAYFLDATERHAAQDEVARALGQERRSKKALVGAAQQRDVADSRAVALADVALALTSAASVEDLERIVVGQGLAVLGVDGGAVISPTPTGSWRTTVSEVFGPRAQLIFGDAPYDSPLPGCWSARTGERLLLPTRAAGLAFHPVMQSVYDETGRSAWAFLPLVVEGRGLGSLAVAWIEEHEVTPADEALLAGFAAQCAQALQRIRATEAERAVAREVRELARSLQRSLLTEPPQPEHLEIAVRYHPAADVAEVGGDWYDAFLQRNGDVTLVIGDVVGHDSIAAARMGQLRGLLRALSYGGDDASGGEPADVLTRCERAARGLAINTYATAILARVTRDPDGGSCSLRWSNAGHLAPIVLYPDGTTEVLERDADLMLGIDARTPRHDHAADLSPGTTVLLYTDGLVERRHSSLDQGIAALRAVLAPLAETPLEKLCDVVLDQMASASVRDDTALLAVRIGPKTGG